MTRRSIILVVTGVAAVIVGLFVLVTTQGDDDDGTAEAQDVRVLVATEEIPAGADAGEALAEGQITLVAVSPEDREPGALTDPTDLDGRDFVVPVAQGQQVLATTLERPPLRSASIEVPEGTEAIAVEMPFAAGGAGYIAAGDRVNVLALLDQPTGPDGVSLSSTVLVLEGVAVLDVSTELAPRTATRTVDGNGSTATTTGSGSASTVTTALPDQLTYLLAVPADQVEELVQAAGYHRLYLTLPADDADTRPAPATASDADLLEGTP